MVDKTTRVKKLVQYIAIFLLLLLICLAITLIISRISSISDSTVDSSTNVIDTPTANITQLDTVVATYAPSPPATSTIPTISIIYKGCDLDTDGKINFKDYLFFVEDYKEYFKQKIYNKESDFNNDGRVDLQDYYIFINYFKDKRS